MCTQGMSIWGYMRVIILLKIIDGKGALSLVHAPAM